MQNDVHVFTCACSCRFAYRMQCHASDGTRYIWRKWCSPSLIASISSEHLTLCFLADHSVNLVSLSIRCHSTRWRQCKVLPAIGRRGFVFGLPQLAFTPLSTSHLYLVSARRAAALSDDTTKHQTLQLSSQYYSSIAHIQASDCFEQFDHWFWNRNKVCLGFARRTFCCSVFIS